MGLYKLEVLAITTCAVKKGNTDMGINYLS